MTKKFILLNDLLFYAYHGIHDEERILGNEYKVDTKIEYLQDDKTSSINDTINYVDIYEIIQSIMSIPTPLLETLSENIIDAIANSDNRIVNVSVRIFKMHAPIHHFSGNVGVSMQKKIQ